MDILFLAANPIGTQRLRVDLEMRMIDQRLRGASLRDQFNLNVQLAVRYNDLAEALLRFSPHIVHFAGHGSVQGEIILEDANGIAHPVSPDTLARLLHVLRDNVRCVVLNACWTAERAEKIAEVIDCVVGMAWTVADKDAINFASGFYQALGYGRSIQEAFELGGIEIELDTGTSERMTPVLICRSGVQASEIMLARPRN
jgi:CHAT domain-containing protein